MADCPYTCFDRVLNQVSRIPKEDTEKMEELYQICTDDSLIDVLDFGVANGLFTESQSTTLYEGIIMWEDLNGNYYEEDPDKYDALLSHMGVDFDKLQEWRLAREENERE